MIAITYVLWSTVEPVERLLGSLQFNPFTPRVKPIESINVSFESVHETLVCDHSNDSYWAVRLSGRLFVMDNFTKWNSRFFPQFWTFVFGFQIFPLWTTSLSNLCQRRHQPPLPVENWAAYPIRGYVYGSTPHPPGITVVSKLFCWSSQLLPPPQGGDSGLKLTGRYEWSHKLIPQNPPWAERYTVPLPWTKTKSPKIPCLFSISKKN